MYHKISIPLINTLFVILYSFNIFGQEVKLEDLTSSFVDEMIQCIKTEGKVSRKSLAVLECETKGKLPEQITLDLSDIIITELKKTNKFELIERNKLEQIIKEQNLILAGFVDETKAVEVGKLSGARYLLVGSISSANKTMVDKFAYYNVHIEVGVDIRIIDTETGKIIYTESAIGQNDNKIIQTSKGETISGNIDYNVSFSNAARSAVEIVVSKVGNISPVLGTVIKSTDEDVLIDLGKEQLIIPGQKLFVFRIKNEVIHPVTNKLLGYEKELIGTIVITQIDNNFSKSEIDDLEGSEAIRAGDFVISQNKNLED